MAKEEPKKEKKSKSRAAAKETSAVDSTPGPRVAVVASVAAFVEAGGFSRTLAALHSEADLEAGAWRSSSVNLEELVAKFLELSNPTPVDVAVESVEQRRIFVHYAIAGKKRKPEEVEASNPSAAEKEQSSPRALRPPPLAARPHSFSAAAPVEKLQN
ncbi:unnamed protein product [Urochloa humidicola]